MYAEVIRMRVLGLLIGIRQNDLRPLPSDDRHQAPDRFVESFKTPMLIIHNQLDFRVPISQGEALFTALQRRGIASEFLSFPDEGHWVLKPANSELWHQTIFSWLARYLNP